MAESVLDVVRHHCEMRIIFAGTPEVAVPSLRALAAAGHDICSVITRQDAPVGRKRVMTQSPVAEAAETLGLPVLKTNTLNDEIAQLISSLEPDLGVIVAYGALVRHPILSIPQLGWINTHFSLLPKWRGAAPVQHSLLAGDATTGVTIFRLDEGLDTGDVVSQLRHDIPSGITAGSLLEELSRVAAPLLCDAVIRLTEPNFVATVQRGQPSFAPKISREEAKLDFTKDRVSVMNHWAGVTPQPGAWSRVGEQTVNLVSIRPADISSNGEQRQPGVCSLSESLAVVGTGSAPIELVSVQPAGKQAMSGADWLRGKPEGVTFQ